MFHEEPLIWFLMGKMVPLSFSSNSESIVTVRQKKTRKGNKHLPLHKQGIFEAPYSNLANFPKKIPISEDKSKGKIRIKIQIWSRYETKTYMQRRSTIHIKCCHEIFLPINHICWRDVQCLFIHLKEYHCASSLKTVYFH